MEKVRTRVPNRPRKTTGDAGPAEGPRSATEPRRESPTSRARKILGNYTTTGRGSAEMSRAARPPLHSFAPFWNPKFSNHNFSQNIVEKLLLVLGCINANSFPCIRTFQQETFKIFARCRRQPTADLVGLSSTFLPDSAHVYMHLVSNTYFQRIFVHVATRDQKFPVFRGVRPLRADSQLLASRKCSVSQ